MSTALAGALGALDIEAENARLERLSPEQRLAFAVDVFGASLLFTSSFGAGSGVLLHLWSKVARHLPVVFLDTGFLFDETLAYRDRIAERFGLLVETVHPAIPRDEFTVEHGADIYARNPDFCCATNKVEPLRPYVAKANGWVSGLRRDQSSTRASTPVLLASDEGPIKVHPLCDVTAESVAAYMAKHEIPEHPLRARRYLSIGCWPCTRPVEDGEDERAGRWAGTGKTECGIHTNLARKSAT